MHTMRSTEIKYYSDIYRDKVHTMTSTEMKYPNKIYRNNELQWHLRTITAACYISIYYTIYRYNEEYRLCWCEFIL